MFLTWFMHWSVPLSAADRVASAPSAAERFAIIIDGLCRSVAARGSAGVMAEALVWLIWRRLRRVDFLVQAMVVRFRAGTLWFRARSPRAPVVRTGVARADTHVPRAFGWLMPLMPYVAAGYASQLRHLLADPEMAALLAATPRMGRILRPLCRMLGLEVGVLVPRPGLALDGVVVADVVAVGVVVGAVVGVAASAGVEQSALLALPDGAKSDKAWLVGDADVPADFRA